MDAQALSLILQVSEWAQESLLVPSISGDFYSGVSQIILNKILVQSTPTNAKFPSTLVKAISYSFNNIFEGVRERNIERDSFILSQEADGQSKTNYQLLILPLHHYICSHELEEAAERTSGKTKKQGVRGKATKWRTYGRQKGNKTDRRHKLHVMTVSKKNNSSNTK